MRKFLPVLLFILQVKFSHTQIIASADTSICVGGTASLVVLSAPSYGTSSYTFETIPYSPETYAGTVPLQLSGLTLTDDSYSAPINIGFSFCFLGVAYTQCYIGSNGWVSFGGAGALTTTYTSAPIPSMAASVPKNCIMGPWQDWHPGLCGGTCIKYQTIGVAPNRKFVVSYDNVPMFSCTTTYGKFQIVLNETTNIIENHLTNKPTCMGWAGGTATQGVHNLAGTVAFTAPGRNSTVWTTTNESTRFVPSGITWYAGPTIVGYGDTIFVSPTTTTTYTASLTACDGTNYTEDVVVTVIDNDPTFDYSPFYCTDATAVPTIAGTAGGTFTSAPAGMTIDPATGVIDLAATTPGSYSVTYSFGGTCPASASDLVTIIADPDATFGYSSTTYCQSGTTLPTFITTPGGSFTVSPAGLVVDPVTGEIDLATGTVGTTYTITYTIGVLCVSTFDFMVTIVPDDDPTFSYSAPDYCPSGTTAPVSMGTGGGSFTVAPPGLSVDPVTGVIDLSTGTVGTTYTITYTTPAGPCTSSSSETVTIDPLDDPAFGYSAPDYCPSGTMAPAFVSTPGGTFSISPATMGIDPVTGTVLLSSGDIGTTYTITYTTPAGPCTNSSTETILIDPLDDPAFSYGATDFCNSGFAAITMVATPGGTYSVMPAGLTVNAGTGLIDLASGTPGMSYTITYTTPAGMCSDFSSVVINILPLTDAAFSFDNSAYCATGTVIPNSILNPGGSFSAMAGISINTFTGEINLSACTPGGPYEVYYTSPGCPETDTFDITIFPMPTPTIDIPANVCIEGAPVLITGNPIGGIISGDEVIGDMFDPSLTTGPGIYSADYTYTDVNGCTSTVTGFIEVIQNTVDAGMDQYIPEYGTGYLNASGGVSFLWSPPDSLSCFDCPDPSFTILNTTTFTVTSWDAFGCVDSDDVLITIVPVFDPVVYLPNTFTPNGDNINDYFFAYGTDLAMIVSMNIYDRNGSLIYQSENVSAADPSQGWDGTTNGKTLNNGVYAYWVQVMLEDGMKQTIKGNVTLIR